jgi:polyhydroxyalkanoate synthesis regulator phasin
MGRPSTRGALVAVLSLVALLTVGATAASAHGGKRGGGSGGASVGALVTQAAKELGVTRAKLVTAIEESAVAAIDDAVEDGDLDADDAAELKDEAGDNLRTAYALSRTRTVASELGVTTAKLNTEFRDARKALATARIDEALADGDIDAEEAADRKADLADAELPGYKGGRGFGFGGGPGHHGGRR